jgi:hypothetical protein
LEKTIMSDKHAQCDKRQDNRDRLRRKAEAVGLYVEVLESRLMLDSGGSSPFRYAVMLRYELAANPATEVQNYPRWDARRVTDAVHEHLVITRQPGSPQLFGYVFAGVPFSVSAAVVDNHGRVLTSFNGRMSVSLAANPGGATLGGNVTTAAKNGVVVFSGLTLSKPGNGCVLVVSGEGLVAKTAHFDVQVNYVYHIE